MTPFLLLVQVGVAAWMVYEAIRAVTPVHPALQPILVAGVCWALTMAPPIVLLVLNAAAVTAILRMIASRSHNVAEPMLVRRSGGQKKRERAGGVTPLP